MKALLVSFSSIYYIQYVYRRQKKVFETDCGKGWVILGCSTNDDDKSAIGEIPEKSGVIRVDDFIQGLAIKSNGQGGTKGRRIKIIVYQA